jgi:hypothetical protein
VVNEAVRRGLAPSSPRPSVEPPVFDLGGLRMTAEQAEALGEDAEVVRFLRVTEQMERGLK